jgi:hypothetical protein
MKEGLYLHKSQDYMFEYVFTGLRLCTTVTSNGVFPMDSFVLSVIVGIHYEYIGEV